MLCFRICTPCFPPCPHCSRPIEPSSDQIASTQVILPTAPGVSNEGGSSPLLALAPAVPWPWGPAWGSLEPPRRDGENAQKTGKNGEKMGEIRPKECEPRELTKDQLAGAGADGGLAGEPVRGAQPPAAGVPGPDRHGLLSRVCVRNDPSFCIYNS